jgi:hypothetical protein
MTAVCRLNRAEYHRLREAPSWNRPDPGGSRGGQRRSRRGVIAPGHSRCDERPKQRVDQPPDSSTFGQRAYGLHPHLHLARDTRARRGNGNRIPRSGQCASRYRKLLRAGSAAGDRQRDGRGVGANHTVATGLGLVRGHLCRDRVSAARPLLPASCGRPATGPLPGVRDPGARHGLHEPHGRAGRAAPGLGAEPQGAEAGHRRSPLGTAASQGALHRSQQPMRRHPAPRADHLAGTSCGREGATRVQGPGPDQLRRLIER